MPMYVELVSNLFQSKINSIGLAIRSKMDERGKLILSMQEKLPKFECYFMLRSIQTLPIVVKSIDNISVEDAENITFLHKKILEIQNEITDLNSLRVEYVKAYEYWKSQN